MADNSVQETLALLKSMGSNDELSKSITTGTGLVAYDLQAPAKNLYPVYTPLRNVIPRVDGGIGLATNWRVVSGINGSGYDAMGWVPEGQRSGRMSYVTANKSAAYVTIGEEDQISYEAIHAGVGFEDLMATMQLRLLQKIMLKEEQAILFGNASVNLGTPTTPTLTKGGSTGLLTTATYSVIVVALTGEGFRNSSIAGGVATTKSITGADGSNFTLNGGCSNQSAAASQAVTLGEILYATVPAITGAVGYAWYIGTAGNEKLEKITTINSAAFTTAAVGGTRQAATAVTGDYSKNANYAFDGLVTSAALAAGSSNAYWSSLATGTAGTGTGLTGSGRGSVVEIDNMLKSMYDSYQVSPDVIYVNSQELKNITNKVFVGNSSSSLLRYNSDGGSDPMAIMAGNVVAAYFNPFSNDGGHKIPIKIHPMVPAGTILAFSGTLPPAYLSNNVPNVVEMRTRKDYYAISWPIVTRQQAAGVYCEETMAVYAPFCMGVINNIADV